MFIAIFYRFFHHYYHHHRCDHQRGCVVYCHSMDNKKNAFIFFFRFLLCLSFLFICHPLAFPLTFNSMDWNSFLFHFACYIIAHSNLNLLSFSVFMLNFNKVYLIFHRPSMCVSVCCCVSLMEMLNKIVVYCFFFWVDMNNCLQSCVPNEFILHCKAMWCAVTVRSIWLHSFFLFIAIVSLLYVWTNIGYYQTDPY